MEQNMFKRKRRCETKCLEHAFQITNAENSKYDIMVSFCPKYYRYPKPPEQTHPVFNLDYQYFTSAFILGVDRRILACSHQQQLAQHNKQIRQSLQKPGTILFPRPHKKHTLCSVCKQKYTNYYAHIMSMEHKLRINNSQYNNFILELQDLYKELHVQLAPVPLRIVDIACKKNQKSTEPEDNNGGDTDNKNESDLNKKKEEKKIADEIVSTNKNLQIIPNQIAQYIISSDSNDQDSQSDTSCQIHSVQTISSRLDTSSSSQSSSSSSSQSRGREKIKSKVKNEQITEINLSSDDSVQIISVFQPNKAKTKKKAKSKKCLKMKEKTGQNVESNHKNQKNKKTKTIKKTNQQPPREKIRMKPGPKPRSRFIDLSSSREGAEYLIKSTKMKYQPHPVNRPAQILIQKSQIDDPMLQVAMQNILDSIVETINPNKKLNLSFIPSFMRENNDEIRFDENDNEDEKSYRLEDEHNQSSANFNEIANQENIAQSIENLPISFDKSDLQKEKEIDNKQLHDIKPIQNSNDHQNFLIAKSIKKQLMQNNIQRPIESQTSKNHHKNSQLNFKPKVQVQLRQNKKRPPRESPSDCFKSTNFGRKRVITNDLQTIPKTKGKMISLDEDEIVEVVISKNKNKIDMQVIKQYEEKKINQKHTSKKNVSNQAQRGQKQGQKESFTQKKCAYNYKSKQNTNFGEAVTRQIQADPLLSTLYVTNVEISPLCVSNLLSLTSPNQQSDEPEQKIEKVLLTDPI